MPTNYLDISILEQKWLRYKIKFYLPYFIISLLFALVILVLYMLQSLSTDSPKPEIKKIITQEHKTILEPSYDFMKNINLSKPIKEKKVKKKKLIVKNTIKINRQNTKNDMNIILQRFKHTNNPALSLFIAKKYYFLKDYKKSYKYAFITNELDNKIEDSWIIFIKSMVKLDKKARAIKTLKSYISFSNSKKAKQLLNEINSGKFQ